MQQCQDIVTASFMRACTARRTASTLSILTGTITCTPTQDSLFVQLSLPYPLSLMVLVLVLLVLKHHQLQLHLQQLGI
jgi:hypothetical protein